MTTLGIWIAAIGMLAIFSLLVKENPVYRVAEHIFLGVATGNALVVGFNTLKGSAFKPLAEGKTLLIIPVILGVLLYTRYFKDIAWVSRIPMAVLIGVGTGAAVRTTIWDNLLKQISATALPLNSFDNIVMVVGVICGLSYFFFTKEMKGGLSTVPRIGRWVMMVAFGASFGNAAMGRLTILIGRISYLMRDWLHVIQ